MSMEGVSETSKRVHVALEMAIAIEITRPRSNCIIAAPPPVVVALTSSAVLAMVTDWVDWVDSVELCLRFVYACCLLLVRVY
jgi:hypothetical protein